jgi:PleD family two-component response regulator
VLRSAAHLDETFVAAAIWSARYGGEEFRSCSGVTPPRCVYAERLRVGSGDSAFLTALEDGSITISGGVATVARISPSQAGCSLRIERYIERNARQESNCHRRRRRS